MFADYELSSYTITAVPDEQGGFVKMWESLDDGNATCLRIPLDNPHVNYEFQQVSKMANCVDGQLSGYDERFAGVFAAFFASQREDSNQQLRELNDDQEFTRKHQVIFIHTLMVLTEGQW